MKEIPKKYNVLRQQIKTELKKMIIKSSYSRCSEKKEAWFQKKRTPRINLKNGRDSKKKNKIHV